MSTGYRAVQWNRFKGRYDLYLWLAILAYLASFLVAGALIFPDADETTLLIRGLGSAAFAMLHVVLCMGPLSRLDRRFLALLYNRRHFGVSLFVLASAHVVLAVIQYHALGDVAWPVSLLTSGSPLDAPAGIPFEFFGLAAFVVLLYTATTSHDFWLRNLTPPVWKLLHMGVYAAYALLVLHVAYGFLQQDQDPAYVIVLGLGIACVVGLHLISALRGRREDCDPALTAAGFIDLGNMGEVPDGHARTVVAAGERVAIFRKGDYLCALSSVCRHQNGPLGEGRIIDGLVTCPWHGYQYRPEDGCSPPPFTEKVPTFQMHRIDGRLVLDPRPRPAGTAVPPLLYPAAEPVPDAAPLFVGYLPVPQALDIWLRRLVPLAVVLAAFLGGLLVARQDGFAVAAYAFGEPREFTGIVVAQPYPMLIVENPMPGADGRSGAFQRYWLVSQGKHGAQQQVTGYDGQLVRLHAELINRDDQQMLKLVDAPFEVIAGGLPDHEPAADLTQEGIVEGSRRLLGEIVDSQCFLGVMKPGHGRTHRGCAIRCLSGGVPPLLYVRGAPGAGQYYLVVGPDGQAINRSVLPFAARPLVVEGEVHRYGSLRTIRTRPGGIRAAN